MAKWQVCRIEKRSPRNDPSVVYFLGIASLDDGYEGNMYKTEFFGVPDTQNENAAYTNITSWILSDGWEPIQANMTGRIIAFRRQLS